MLGSEAKASIKNADSLIDLGTTATDEQLTHLVLKQLMTRLLSLILKRMFHIL